MNSVWMLVCIVFGVVYDVVVGGYVGNLVFVMVVGCVGGGVGLLVCGLFVGIVIVVFDMLYIDGFCVGVLFVFDGGVGDFVMYCLDLMCGV